MKRTKSQRIFNKETGKYEYTPAVITDFHCNVDEYFNNNGKRCTFFKQLRKHLFGEDYTIFIPEHEEHDWTSSILDNKEVYYTVPDHEEWTTTGSLSCERTSEEVIKKVVKEVTGREPEVKVWQHDVNEYFKDVTISFPNTKVPTLKYVFNEEFDRDFEEDHLVLLGYPDDYGPNGTYVEKFYKFILDGLYILFKNMKSDWGKAHANYFSPDSTFTYEYKDWKVNKVKK